MVLNLSGERPRNRSASETEKSFLPIIFARTLFGEKIPNITKAKIDNNKIELTINSLYHINGRTFSDAPWFLFSYSGKRDKEPALKFSLNSENKYDFRFETTNFHQTLSEIFTKNPSRDDKTLEKVGLKVSDQAEIWLNYDAPIAFWRGLPKELRDSISEADFIGDFYKIAWPLNGSLDNVRSKPLKSDELSVRTMDAITYNQRDKEYQNLINMLSETGFVEYQLIKKTKDFPSEEHHFKIDNKLDYDKLQILEEIARHDSNVLQRKTYSESKSRIIVEGKVDRNIFSKIPRDFNNYLEGAKVQAGLITVTYNKKNKLKDKPVHIYLQDASLEDVERFMQLKAVSRDNIMIIPKEESGIKKTPAIFSDDGSECKSYSYL